MEKITTFCGEVVDSTSPPISEMEATQSASFGLYSYDPNARLNQQSPPTQVCLPGWSGYSTSQNPNNTFFGMNPPTINPYINGYNYQQQYYGYGIGAGYNNPYYYNQYYQQQTPQQQNLTIHIDSVNINGEYLPCSNYEEKIAELQREFWTREQEQYAKQSAQSSNYTNFGYNYYGNPYYNNYYGYNSLRNEANQIILEMQNEARENRKKFNINLSKLAHNISSGGNYNEDVIEEMYTGKDIDNPCGITYTDLYAQNRFVNLVPFDNSQMYANHQLAVSAEYSNIIRPDSNMQECFSNMGILNAQYELEKEAHRRKNYSTLYDSSDSGYKYFVRRKAAERYNNQSNIQSQIIPNNNINLARSMVTQFPTLSNAASLSPDGTLTVTCNFGSKQGQSYSVNQNEAQYNEQRERFNRFIDSIPTSIYNNSGGGN